MPNHAHSLVGDFDL